MLVCFALSSESLDTWSLLPTRRIRVGGTQAALDKWVVYLWQSGSALQVTGAELKIATRQL